MAVTSLLVALSISASRARSPACRASIRGQAFGIGEGREAGIQGVHDGVFVHGLGWCES
jgi:hypothetical protein